MYSQGTWIFSWRKELGSDRCWGLIAWRRFSHCLGLVQSPQGQLLYLQKSHGFPSICLLKEAGGRFVVCWSALILQTSNPSPGISRNMLAVGLCGHTESGMVLGIIIPLDSCVSPALLGCRKHNLQKTQMEPQGIGVNCKDTLGRMKSELPQYTHRKAHGTDFFFFFLIQDTTALVSL